MSFDSMQIDKNKKVAKNTFLLYVRMLLVILVNLYTSRVILNVLGVEDFGIYNVVGGVVMMFSFLNTAMSVGTQRFLAYEMGHGHDGVQQVFVTGVHVHFFISLIIVVLSETVGLWFLTNQMQIQTERLDAAIWVFHSAVLSFVLLVNTVPYVSLVMAKEDMGVYALVSIIETGLKLLVVISLDWFHYDKLKVYALCGIFVAFGVYMIYAVFCRMRYVEVQYRFQWNTKLFSRMLTYSCWNLFGGFANVCNNYGLNIILNLYFGVIVNAARGIAYQVNSAVANFTINFQSALNPPIIKAYAREEYHYMQMLIYRGAKYSFFLLYFLSLPLYICTPYVLEVWLINVPEHAVAFTRWVLVTSLVDSLSGTLMIASQASGRIKRYQLVTGLFLLLNIPLSYVCLIFFHNPDLVFIISFCISVLAFFIRLYLVSCLVPISIIIFIRKVVCPLFPIILLTSLIPYIVYINLGAHLYTFLVVCLLSWMICIFIYWIIGLEQDEKCFVKSQINNIISKIKR